MYIAVKPTPKPRLTQRDRWAKRPIVVRYYAFCDELRLRYRQKLPSRLHLIFYVEMPKSWSNKKKLQMAGKPHQTRPDIDNLSKAVMDALCDDDGYIYDQRSTKYWAVEPGIDIKTLI